MLGYLARTNFSVSPILEIISTIHFVNVKRSFICVTIYVPVHSKRNHCKHTLVCSYPTNLHQRQRLREEHSIRVVLHGLASALGRDLHSIPAIQQSSASLFNDRLRPEATVDSGCLSLHGFSLVVGIPVTRFPSSMCVCVFRCLQIFENVCCVSVC